MLRPAWQATRLSGLQPAALCHLEGWALGRGELCCSAGYPDWVWGAGSMVWASRLRLDMRVCVSLVLV